MEEVQNLFWQKSMLIVAKHSLIEAKQTPFGRANQANEERIKNPVFKVIFYLVFS